MDIKTNVRLPDYLQTPMPAHDRHADIINFLLSDFDMPDWLRADLHGNGRYRPAVGPFVRFLMFGNALTVCIAR